MIAGARDAQAEANLTHCGSGPFAPLRLLATPAAIGNKDARDPEEIIAYLSTVSIFATIAFAG